MKTMTAAEFTAFLSRTDWKTEQEIHHGIEGERAVGQWDEVADCFEQTIIPFASGYACRISTLEGVRIAYNENFEYDFYESTSLKTDCEMHDDVWEIEGIEIIDEDGETLSWPDFEHLFPRAFSLIDYSELNIDQVMEVDNTSNDGLDQVTVKNDYAPSLRFSGKTLGSVLNEINPRIDMSERQFKLTLYQSVMGRYVCERIGYARWAEEQDFHQAKVCDSVAEVKTFFGDKPLAIELYQRAGL